ncbi:MAG: hypothetical protein ACLUB5_02275 [Bifidobacterium dentium]
MIVTHNMQQAARIADYTVLQLKAVGQPGHSSTSPTRHHVQQPQNEEAERYVSDALAIGKPVSQR